MKALTLILLAMVGTGFGQTTSIRQKTGFSCNLPGTTARATWACEFNLRNIYAQPESTCYCEADQIISPATMPKWIAGRAPEGVDDRVDVPAIQEKQTSGKIDGVPICLREPDDGSFVHCIPPSMVPVKWTCEDKENRALLTSVNGRKHSCHLIQD